LTRTRGIVSNRHNTGRPILDIIASPMLNETVPAESLGKAGGNRFIWFACLTCGLPRWIKNKPVYKSILHCPHCQKRFRDCRKYKPDSKNSLHKTVLATATLRIGDVIRGTDIGRQNKIHVWLACPECSKHPHWVRKRNPLRGNLCPECANKPEHKPGGVKCGTWRGGRHANHEGYMVVRILSNSPFYSMSQRGGILEHRLVMAQHLGRCLHSWEIIHHKHTKFPRGSTKDKQDNRLDNLELIQVPLKHVAIIELEKKAVYLLEQVDKLKVEVKLQKWQIRELTEQTRVLSTSLKRVGAS